MNLIVLFATSSHIQEVKVLTKWSRNQESMRCNSLMWAWDDSVSSTAQASLLQVDAPPTNR